MQPLPTFRSLFCQLAHQGPARLALPLLQHVNRAAVVCAVVSQVHVASCVLCPRRSHQFMVNSLLLCH